jgi:uncharacterized protein (DUF58 family)
LLPKRFLIFWGLSLLLTLSVVIPFPSFDFERSYSFKEGKGITTLKVKRRERNNYAQSQKKGKE